MRPSSEKGPSTPPPSPPWRRAKSEEGVLLSLATPQVREFVMCCACIRIRIKWSGWLGSFSLKAPG